jgi:hypothetical protein
MHREAAAKGGAASRILGVEAVGDPAPLDCADRPMTGPAREEARPPTQQSGQPSRPAESQRRGQSEDGAPSVLERPVVALRHVRVPPHLAKEGSA